jgi:four helix bundle protein
MSKPNFMNLRVYQLSEILADEIWIIVTNWKYFEKETVGKQLVKAADSIGANIAEGTGRGSFQDNRRFVKIARGSLNETQHWLRRAYKRDLLKEKEVNRLKPIVDELSPKLNAYLKSIGKIPGEKNNRQLTTINGHY